MNNYYQILEVESNASQDQIKSQYRFLAQAWHPDKFGSSESKAKAEEKLKQINEAFGVLKDAAKREQYDRVRQHAQKGHNNQTQSDYERQRREQEAKARAEAEIKAEADRREREQAEFYRREQEAKTRVEFEKRQREQEPHSRTESKKDFAEKTNAHKNTFAKLYADFTRLIFWGARLFLYPFCVWSYINGDATNVFGTIIAIIITEFFIFAFKD